MALFGCPAVLFLGKTVNKGIKQDKMDKIKTVVDGQEPLRTDCGSTCCRVLRKGLKQEIRDECPVVQTVFPCYPRNKDESECANACCPCYECATAAHERHDEDVARMQCNQESSDGGEGGEDQNVQIAKPIVALKPLQPSWFPKFAGKEPTVSLDVLMDSFIDLAKKDRDNTAQELMALKSRVSKVERQANCVDENVFALAAVIKGLDMEILNFKKQLKTFQDDAIDKTIGVVSSVLSVRNDLSVELASMRKALEIDELEGANGAVTPGQKILADRVELDLRTAVAALQGSTLQSARKYGPCGPLVKSRIEALRAAVSGKIAPMSTAAMYFNIAGEECIEEAGVDFEIVD